MAQPEMASWSLSPVRTRAPHKKSSTWGISSSMYASRNQRGDEQRRGSEMSAWYAISGTVRVRGCPEVDAIAAKIRAHCDRDFAVNLVPVDAEVDEFSIEGTCEFAAGGVLALDETLESLGPYAVEAA